MKDQLEYPARELWKSLGKKWNKDIVAKRNEYDDAYAARIELDERRTVEYLDLLVDYTEETNHEPSELTYLIDSLPIIRVQSETDHFRYSQLNPIGKRTLQYGISSEDYDTLMRLLCETGPLGERLTQARRYGNPKIVSAVSGHMTLDTFEGLTEFFHSFITKSEGILPRRV